MTYDEVLTTAQTQTSSTPAKSIRGRFCKGHDPRRHILTREDCQKGFQAAILSIAQRYPEAYNPSTHTHMVKFFLRRKA